MISITFRITLLHPPRGVVFRLQRGRSELIAPSFESAGSVSFEFTLRVASDEAGRPPRLLGPFAQGPPNARFVYVNSGKQAGQAESCWDRRAKVPLRDISVSLIAHAAASDAVIETQISGTAGDGGPACATVPLIGGWRIAS